MHHVWQRNGSDDVTRLACLPQVLSQAKKFMEHFHAKQKEKLAHLLANERWTRANVPAECQEVIAWITDPKRLLDSASLTTPHSPGRGEHAPDDAPDSVSAGTNGSVETVPAVSPPASPSRGVRTCMHVCVCFCECACVYLGV